MRVILFTVLICLAMSFSAVAKQHTVKYGDTISSILSNDYTSLEIHKISQELRKSVPKFMLKVGMKYRLSEGVFTLSMSGTQDLIIYKEEEDPQVKVLTYKEHTMLTVISGDIKTSLFDSIYDLGEDLELAATIARIYEWEFNFFRDIQPGDSYTVLIEKRFVRDKYVGYGKLYAADFTVKGKSYKAYYYDDGKKHGYYNDEGRPLERGFLRVPLSYTRVSSVFSDNRLHPVLKERRPHYGVDYAAPTGTPIMTTATGVVMQKTYNKASGNFVEIRHPNGYNTFYLHMSRFNSNVRVGSTVQQGDVIGYVGSTGYATGPHLDYRIKKDGKWLNPLNFVAEVPKLNKDARTILTKISVAYEEDIRRANDFNTLLMHRYVP